MALFRGIGYILLGTGSVNVFPDAFIDFGIDNVPGTPIPWTIVPFLVLAPVFAVVLQKHADRPAHLRASAATRTRRSIPASSTRRMRF